MFNYMSVVITFNLMSKQTHYGHFCSIMYMAMTFNLMWTLIFIIIKFVHILCLNIHGNDLLSAEVTKRLIYL